MIESLEDAWEWYKAVRMLAQDMRKLAAKWDTDEFQALVNRDNQLRDRAGPELAARSIRILDDLDDLAVLLMFSVFEATVRDRARSDVEREADSIRHPAILRAVKSLMNAIENGSFGQVTESYKAMDVDLTEQVNQVRKYRNWVAHGRRGVPDNQVVPDSAIERLGNYLERLAQAELAATRVPPPVDAGPETAPESA
jgi:hypothetical protein